MTDGRKTSWTLERRAAASAYRKAHPQGNRDPKWWNDQRKAEAMEKLIRGWEAKRSEQRESAGDRTLP